MYIKRNWMNGIKPVIWLPMVISLCSTAAARSVRRNSDSMNKENRENQWRYSASVHYGVSKDGAASSIASKDNNQDARDFSRFIKEEEEPEESKLNHLTDSPACSKSSMGLRRIQRGKRFVAHVTKWSHRDIRWRFRDPFDVFQNRTDYNIAKETLAHAFSMWSFASKNALRFHDVPEENASSFNDTQTVDIDVFFAVGDHGDHEPFDGRGGIVAHSGYPPEGKIHFDASELWMINGDSGIDLRYVMLHETGHALGLRHSRHKNAIMYPIYKSKTRQIALSDDDIKGIRYLYPEGMSGRAYSSFLRNQSMSEKKISIDFEDY